MAKQKSTGWLDKYNDGKVAQADATRTKNTKNLGIKKGSDQPIGNMLDITLGAPQRQAVKMITGKEQSPSEAMDIQNPYGAFAADAILDPVNLIGAGIAGKIAKASTETGLLSKAYKLNPWAFKPNEANWYRQVGKSAIDDAFDTRLIREVGEEVSPRMWGEFQDQIKRLQGDDALGHEERMMQKILASRRPISPFFAKGELFYPMGRKEIITKSGKISKNSAGRGNADYLIETALPNESFQPAFVKGMSLGVPDMVGSTAILKPNPSLRDVSNFQLYKQDWLQGYKKLPKKENGGWLDKYNDGGPVQENYNDYSVSAPEGFQGDGYSNVGRNYSPAWGGQFAMGGALPGATGHMYARVGAPSKGPHRNQTDVTDASAQNGAEMKYYQNGLDWKPKSISRDGDNVAYADNTRVGNVPRYTRPSNYQGNQPDTLGENIFEIVDPSGISSWDDIYRSYNQTGMSGQTAMEAVGAIPMLGKLKKAGQFLDIVSKAVPMTGRQAKNVKNSVTALKVAGKYGPSVGRATDAYQAYDQYKQGGQLTKLDQLLNFTNYNTKQPGDWLDKYNN
jgi:hypothetical protein